MHAGARSHASLRASLAMAAAPHAHAAGDGCTTWIDDELAERGLELAPEDMPGCCAEDARQAARARVLRARLSEADPTRKAVALRIEALRAAAVGTPPPQAGEDALDSGDESSDFGEDAEEEVEPALRALRAARLKQLLADAAARSASAAASPTLTEAQLPSAASQHKLLVLHLPLPGLPASESCSEALAALARAHPGTRFAQLVPTSGAAAPLGADAAHLLGCVPGGRVRAPALAVLRRGRPAALQLGYAPFGLDGEVEERKLGRWLAAAGALGKEAVVERGEGSSSEDEGGGVVGAPGAPCAACGRTYPHEHVRALRGAAVEAESDEDE